MSRPLAAVVFDLDDTLYPEADFVQGGLIAAARELGVPEAEGVFLDILRNEGPLHVFDSGLRQLGIPRTPAQIASLVGAFRSHRPSLRPFAGTRQMLARLRQSGLKLALLTDGYLEVQQRKIESLGIANMFDQVLFTSDVEGRPMPKPDPGPFHLLQARFGVECETVVMVGDRPDKDFPAPDLLGWRTLRTRHPGAFHRDDHDPRNDRPDACSVRSMERLLAVWIAAPGLPKKN